MSTFVRGVVLFSGCWFVPKKTVDARAAELLRTTLDKQTLNIRTVLHHFYSRLHCILKQAGPVHGL